MASKLLTKSLYYFKADNTLEKLVVYIAHSLRIYLMYLMGFQGSEEKRIYLLKCLSTI